MRRFEVTFNDGSVRVATAERCEEIGGWMYFFVQGGGWVLKAPSHEIRFITQGEAPTGVSNAQAA